MKIGSIPAQPMDHGILSDVRSIRNSAENLKRRFSFLATPNAITDSVFSDYEHLEIATETNGLGVTIEHFGVTIKFDCLLSLSKDNGAVGRVVCSLQHQLWGPVERQLLGAFAFTDSGVTDLPPDERGRPTRLPNDADRIIAYFLQKAHRAAYLIHVSDDGDTAR